MRITGHKDHFLARCQERGIPLDDAMACVVKMDGDQWTVETDHPAYPSGGAGEKLEQLLKWILIRPGGDCGCQEKARTMDFHGPAWVRDNMDTVRGWLRDAAKQRGIPFFEAIANALIVKAVSDWEKELSELNKADPNAQN
jgi:hypothetical protein